MCVCVGLCMFACVHLQAQTYIRRGPRRGRERYVAKFLLPQILYHFSPPQKSPEREAAATTAAVQTKTVTGSEHLKWPLTCSAEQAYIMNVGFQQTVLTMN